MPTMASMPWVVAIPLMQCPTEGASPAAWAEDRGRHDIFSIARHWPHPPPGACVQRRADGVGSCSQGGGRGRGARRWRSHRGSDAQGGPEGSAGAPPRQKARPRHVAETPGIAVLPPSTSPSLSPLYKTRACKYFQSGQCKAGPLCVFAHGEEDLRPSPDFERTSVCSQMLKYGICTKPGCRYAHRSEDLKISPVMLKTKLCAFHFSRGACIVGEACRFAHTMDELQEALDVQQSAMAKKLPAEERRLLRLSPPAMAAPSGDAASVEPAPGTWTQCYPCDREGRQLRFLAAWNSAGAQAREDEQEELEELEELEEPVLEVLVLEDGPRSRCEIRTASEHEDLCFEL